MKHVTEWDARRNSDKSVSGNVMRVNSQDALEHLLASSQGLDGGGKVPEPTAVPFTRQSSAQTMALPPRHFGREFTFLPPADTQLTEQEVAKKLDILRREFEADCKLIQRNINRQLVPFEAVSKPVPEEDGVSTNVVVTDDASSPDRDDGHEDWDARDPSVTGSSPALSLSACSSYRSYDGAIQDDGLDWADNVRLMMGAHEEAWAEQMAIRDQMGRHLQLWQRQHQHSIQTLDRLHNERHDTALFLLEQRQRMDEERARWLHEKQTLLDQYQQREVERNELTEQVRRLETVQEQSQHQFEQVCAKMQADVEEARHSSAHYRDQFMASLARQADLIRLNAQLRDQLKHRQHHEQLVAELRQRLVTEKLMRRVAELEADNRRGKKLCAQLLADYERLQLPPRQS